jgi:type II secretory pathway pseudopilin PulG
MSDIQLSLISTAKVPLTTFHKGRQRSGFTFIEVIVVGLIIVALGAVSIPLYSGFISKQRQETVNNLAQAAATSANAHFRRYAAVPNVSDLGLFISQSDQFTITFSGNFVTVTDNSDPEITASVQYRN